MKQLSMLDQCFSICFFFLQFKPDAVLLTIPDIQRRNSYDENLHRVISSDDELIRHFYHVR